MRKLSSAFPVAPPETARFAPSCAILQSPNFIKKVRKTLFYFSGRSISSGQKKNGHTVFENCVADLLLDDFHAVGGHIKMISEVRRSPPMRN